MISRLRKFSQEECGAISLDWIVLTGVLIATGMAVVSTVSDGVESVSVETGSQLRGQVVQQSFGPDNLCASGVDGVRAQEAARLASGGVDPVDVDAWVSTYANTSSIGALVQERDRLAGLTGRVDGWSREHTLQGLVECRMAQHGI